MAKRGYLWLLVLLLVFPVSAAGETGSVRLNMTYQGSAVPGGTVTLYPISEPDASLLSADPDALAQRDLSDGVSRAVGEDGTVSFYDLENGIYLLVQNHAAGGYYPVKPFCVSIPITVGDELEYHIEAFPKLEPLPETKLPQTGLMRIPVWSLLGGGLSLTALGFLLTKRK